MCEDNDRRGDSTSFSTLSFHNYCSHEPGKDISSRIIATHIKRNFESSNNPFCLLLSLSHVFFSLFISSTLFATLVPICSYFSPSSRAFLGVMRCAVGIMLAVTSRSSSRSLSSDLAFARSCCLMLGRLFVGVSVSGIVWRCEVAMV